MITFKEGSILEDSAEALVNPVNCMGVMGKGLALAFKQIYPGNFKDYLKACRDGEVILGQMFIHSLPNGKRIINFPTKGHWSEPSYLEDIESGLESLAEDIQDINIKSIAIPALGCGLGGLYWPSVLSLIYAYLEHINIDIRVYPPSPSAT